MGELAVTAESPVDVHQHLWPAELIDALRARTSGPRLVGWTLHLPGEPPYQVAPGDHDEQARLALEAGTGLAVASLSSPLGLEDLPPDEAGPLLHAWHTGAARLRAPSTAWAAVTRTDPDLAGLKDLLATDFAGLQIPAGWMATPAALANLAPVLEVCQEADRPVLVHPGAVVDRAERDLPGWWPAVVDYPAQLQAAWFAWHVAGRDLCPDLRIGFVGGAGLAPAHHERLRARGGATGPVDPGVFVETSSYGPQAIDALIRALGIDAIVAGSDRPYVSPSDFRAAPFSLGKAAARAITVTNPRRFLFGGTA